MERTEFNCQSCADKPDASGCIYCGGSGVIVREVWQTEERMAHMSTVGAARAGRVFCDPALAEVHSDEILRRPNVRGSEKSWWASAGTARNDPPFVANGPSPEIAIAYLLKWSIARNATRGLSAADFTIAAIDQQERKEP